MCSKCSTRYPSVNKKYDLCDSCNFSRLHAGKTKASAKAESAARYQENYKLRSSANGTNHSKVRIKAQTNRESVIKGKLSLIKQEIKLEAVQNGEYFCKGCGTGIAELDCSHILSVGQFKALELIKENIQLMCRACHVCWESGHISEQIKLHCFADNIIFIFKYDEVTFNKFITKISDYNRWLIEDKDNRQIHLVTSVIGKIYEHLEIN